MKQDFEQFLMEKHSEQYFGTKDCMIDDFEGWLMELDFNVVINYGDEFAKKQSKGLVSIGAMVDRENATYKTGYNLGFKEGYAKREKDENAILEILKCHENGRHEIEDKEVLVTAIREYVEEKLKEKK